MAEDHIRYDILAQEALRGVMRKVLAEVARTGLPGNHHFFITFLTGAPGVRVSTRLRERYPEQMTIVIQFQYWDLKVTDTGFEVGLSFSDVPEKLEIPFSAVRGFYDPSVNFELEFDVKTEWPTQSRTETRRQPAMARNRPSLEKAEREEEGRRRSRRRSRPTRRPRAPTSSRSTLSARSSRCLTRQSSPGPQAEGARGEGAGRRREPRAARSHQGREAARPPASEKWPPSSTATGANARQRRQGAMSPVQKRSVTIRGHRTSFSLEKPFYDDLARHRRDRGSRSPPSSPKSTKPVRATPICLRRCRLYVLDWAKRARVDGYSVPSASSGNCPPQRMASGSRLAFGRRTIGHRRRARAVTFGALRRGSASTGSSAQRRLRLRSGVSAVPLLRGLRGLRLRLRRLSSASPGLRRPRACSGFRLLPALASASALRRPMPSLLRLGLQPRLFLLLAQQGPRRHSSRSSAAPRSSAPRAAAAASPAAPPASPRPAPAPSPARAASGTAPAARCRTSLRVASGPSTLKRSAGSDPTSASSPGW